jgi:hypothetical protein
MHRCFDECEEKMSTPEQGGGPLRTHPFSPYYHDQNSYAAASHIPVLGDGWSTYVWAKLSVGGIY